MADGRDRDLAALVAAQQAELAAVRAQLARQEVRLTALGARGRRWSRRPDRTLAVLALAVLAALLPAAVLATTPFTDLDPAQAAGHNPNIDAIYAAGITRGCNPPANDNYCPKEFVTREQMASFLARTAGLGGNPPVANALTAVNAQNATNAINATNAANAANAQTAVNAQTATTATTAGNANQLGGQPPSAFLRSTGDQVVAVPAVGMVTFYADTRLDSDYYSTRITSTATGLTRYAGLGLARPVSTFGVSLVVRSLEVCYQVGAQAIVYSFSVQRYGLSYGEYIASLTRNTTSLAECVTIALPVPLAADQGLALEVAMRFSDTSIYTAYVQVESIRLTLAPQ